jgi:uncharacterized protein YjbI with pentapeptide repeats
MKGAKFVLTLTGEAKGEDIAEFDLTLDEMLLQHTAWLATGGRNGKQLILKKTDMRKGPALGGQRLTAIKAYETTFAEMDMRGVEAQGATFEGCDFRKCLIGSADLRGTNFSGSLFIRADLSKANFNPLSFKKADGSEYQIPCNFKKTLLRHAIFSGARLMNAVFAGADLCDADFRDCDLRKADFTGADVSGTRFDGAALEGAVGLTRPA